MRMKKKKLSTFFLFKWNTRNAMITVRNRLYYWLFGQSTITTEDCNCKKKSFIFYSARKKRATSNAIHEFHFDEIPFPLLDLEVKEKLLLRCCCLRRRSKLKNIWIKSFRGEPRWKSAYRRSIIDMTIVNINDFFFSSRD